MELHFRTRRRENLESWILSKEIPRQTFLSRNLLRGFDNLLRGFGDIVKGFAADLFFDLRDISDRDDTDEALILIEDQDAPNLILPHLLGDNLHIVVLKAINDFARHDLARFRCVGVVAFGYSANDDVAIRDSSDETVTFANRYKADIQRLH